jgi:hypothetical protein
VIATRRQTLAGSAALLVALAGCAGTTTVSQGANDLALLAAGLAPVVDAAAPLADPNTVGKIRQYLATIQAASAAVSSATAAPTGVVQEAIAAVNALVPIVLPLLPNGSALVVAAQAALALVPVVLAEFGIAATPTAGKSKPVGMPADTARSALKAVASGPL